MKNILHLEILRKSGRLIKAFLVKNYVFYSFLVLEIVLFSFLNGKNTLMHGILPYYQDFANYFGSGWDSCYIFELNSPTFPMWGYGAILFLFEKKYLLLVVFQQLFTIFTIYTLLSFLKKLNFNKSVCDYTKIILLLFGFPWFIFHSVIWPYSVSANLLVLGLIYLSLGLQNSSFKFFVYSSVCYGILLNFRSDYIYHYFFLSCFLILHLFFRNRKNLTKGFTWIAIVMLFLVPWGLHSKRETGNYLLSSTNSGHVLFISLGQLPNNVWGITPEDGDPIMKSIVKSKFGENAKSLTFGPDKELKRAWLKNIRQYPKEFFRKCGYNIYLTFVRPFTNGEIYKFFIEDDLEQMMMKNEIKSDIEKKDFRSLLNRSFSSRYRGFFIPILLNIFSISIFIFFVILIIMGLFKFRSGIWSNWTLFSIYSVVCYQIALQTIAYYNPNYHTNIFLFYVIISALVLGKYKYDVKEKLSENDLPVIIEDDFV